MAIKDSFNRLKPKKREDIVKIAAFGVILILIVVLVATQKGEQKKVRSSGNDVVETEPAYSSSTFEEATYLETREMLEDMTKRIEELDKQVVTLTKENSELKNRLKEAEQASRVMSSSNATSGGKANVTQTSYGYPASPGSSEHSEQTTSKTTIVVIGDIAHGEASRKIEKKTEEKKKKQQLKVYLPSNTFIPATLLTGAYVPVKQGGKGDFVPMLYARLQDLAVLPNEIKLDLQGCFVSAECLGSLASEQAHCRLKKLSCLFEDGEAVIDQEIKGQLMDGNGMIGLSGRTISKVGPLLLREGVAAALGGLSESLVSQNTNLTLTAEGGALTTLKSGKTFENAGAKGLSAMANVLSDYFKELADQTVPVIAIGNLKPVTVVISEGTYLDIKGVCLAGKDNYERCKKD